MVKFKKLDDMTTKMKLFERLLLVVIIACGASFTANAQLGGLLNKAKTAVSKDKQSNNSNQNAQQSSSNSQSSSQSSQEEELRQKLDAARESETSNDSDNSSSSSVSSPQKPSYPTSLSELDSQLFIYNPADNANNEPFYDVNGANATKAYVDFCNAATMTEYNSRHVGCEVFEFADYQTANGVKQVHLTEYAFNAYYSYFMTNPTEVSGYQVYIRARLMQDCYRFDKVRSFPYIRDAERNQWKAKYPGAENLRKITLEDGKELNLLETETQRQKRWDDVQGEAEDILHANTPYNVIRSVLKGTLGAIKQCDAAGRSADAYNLLREAGYMMEDLESHPLHSKDEQFQGIYEEYNSYFTQKRMGWLKSAGAASSKPVPMPKAASVSAEIQNQATAKAKAKFGDKFVKAIVTESDWHIYKEPNYPYNISHRSISVDVIIKENGEYFVSHQDLRQNYAGGSYSGYDLRNSMKTPLQEKVDYK